MVPFSTRACLGRRAAVTVLLALAFLPGRPAAAGGTRDAEGFVSALGERALAALGEGGDEGQRLRSIAGLLEQAVDLDLVGRLVLGRHWQAATEAQRQEYGRLFRDYFRDGLARRLGACSGGARLALTGSREVGDGDTLVGTRLVLAGASAPVALEWRVRREGDRLVIIDVVAEGVSMLVANRAQFDAVIARSGMDGLLAQMRGWHASVTSRPGDA
jgi:phospholipid transport system substrate-binding protein